MKFCVFLILVLNAMNSLAVGWNLLMSPEDIETISSLYTDSTFDTTRYYDSSQAFHFSPTTGMISGGLVRCGSIIKYVGPTVGVSAIGVCYVKLEVRYMGTPLMDGEIVIEENDSEIIEPTYSKILLYKMKDRVIEVDFRSVGNIGFYE